MLATLGIDAVALGLFGAGARPEIKKAKRATTGALQQDRAAMRARLAGAAVAMDDCFDAAATLEMARAGAEGVAGYASFHGGLSAPERAELP